jgi:bile acid:Na+ symporter, BASS family
MSLLARLGRSGGPALALGLLIGFLAQPLASVLGPVLLPAIVALLFVSLLRLDWRLLAGYGRRPMLPLLATGWMLLLSPLLVWVAVRIVPLPPELALALVAASLGPTIVSSPAFAAMLRLDAELATASVVAGTLLVALTLPTMAGWLAGFEVSLSWDMFAVRILGFVVVPFAAAAVVRRLVGPETLRRNDSALGGLTVLILIVFAIAVMDGMAARLMAQPATVLVYLAAAVAANLGLQLLGGLLFLPAGRRIALTVAISSGNRNVGLIYALAGAALGRDFLLFLAVAQVPMYLTPMLARPVVRALMPDPPDGP